VYVVFVIWFVVLMILGIWRQVRSSQPSRMATNERVAGRHPVLLRLLPADAVVEPLGTPKPVPERVTFKPH
jgi:hypothetical protein